MYSCLQRTARKRRSGGRGRRPVGSAASRTTRRWHQALKLRGKISAHEVPCLSGGPADLRESAVLFGTTHQLNRTRWTPFEDSAEISTFRRTSRSTRTILYPAPGTPRASMSTCGPDPQRERRLQMLFEAHPVTSMYSEVVFCTCLSAH